MIRFLAGLVDLRYRTGFQPGYLIGYLDAWITGAMVYGLFLLARKWGIL